MLISGWRGEFPSEKIPVEPDPDNAGGGKIEFACKTLSPP